jgi:transmembrane sensor
VNRKGATDIDDEAAEWVVRLDANPPGGQDILHDFERWMAEDPRNRGAYVRAQAAWFLLEHGAAPGSGADAITETDAP